MSNTYKDHQNEQDFRKFVNLWKLKHRPRMQAITQISIGVHIKGWMLVFCKLEGAQVTICESNKLRSPQYKSIITKCFKVAKKINENEHRMHIAMCNDTSTNKIGLRERIYQWQWVWWKSLQLHNQWLTRVQSNNPYQKWEHHLHVLLVARRWHVSSYWTFFGILLSWGCQKMFNNLFVLWGMSY